MNACSVGHHMSQCLLMLGVFDVPLNSSKIVIEIRDDFNLIVAGNGPYLSEMKEELKDYPRAHFTGALSRDKLPEIYNAADVFLFPSVTDTFGMVILESLACGLPAYEAAACAVYLHGAAADRAAAKRGEYGMLPHDILPELGALFAENQR